MNHASVARIFSILMLVLAASALIPVLIAVVLGDQQQIFPFLAMALLTAVLASSVLLLTPKPSRKARPADALAVVILWWLLAPVAAAMPFVLGVSNASVLVAIHEATSCLTTTGYSVIYSNPEDWPLSLVVWRAVLHLLGGLASFVTVAGVFAALNLGGPGIHRTVLFTVPEGSYFDTIPRLLRAVSVPFFLLLLMIAVALIVAGVPYPRAVGDAISVLTTGLVHPEAATREAVGPVASIILAIGLCFGGLGLALWLPLQRRTFRTAGTDPEVVTFFVFVSLLTLMAIYISQPVFGAIGWAISAMSTSGMPLTNAGVEQSLPTSLLVLPALLGGSALSAAGGIKLARLVVLTRRAGQEFRQLGYRRSRVTFRFRERELDEKSVIGVWVYLIGYISALFLCLAGFGLLGIEFDTAIRMSIGAISNAGSLIPQGLADAPAGEHLLLMAAMTLGRLEILALLPALLPSFWRG